MNNFFSLQQKPEEHLPEITGYVLISGGLLLISFGILQLFKGDFAYGLGTKYLVPIIREAGYKVLLGIGLLTAAMMSLKYEKSKKKLLTILSDTSFK